MYLHNQNLNCKIDLNILKMLINPSVIETVRNQLDMFGHSLFDENDINFQQDKTPPHDVFSFRPHLYPLDFFL